MLLQGNITVGCSCRLNLLYHATAGLYYCVMLVQVDIIFCKVKLKTRRHE